MIANINFRLLPLLLLCALQAAMPTDLRAQAVAFTGPQHLVLAGLRSVGGKGQFNGVKLDAAGNLYLLLDQGDGVRVLKTDASATNILAESRIGRAGDIGLSLAMDPGGNVYVAGTTTSGGLATTAGAAFGTPLDGSTNSFVAKFDAGLNLLFATLAGGTRIAAISVDATADAVFVTGSIFAATLPVTAGGIQQTAASGSLQNGFVEKFSTDGATLLYATYLTGASGNTAPAAIAVDSSDNAYVAGYTTSPVFPTVGAMVPTILGSTSGFLTKLSPGGSSLIFSTYIPGSGMTSLVIDKSLQNLVLSGSVALGQFPIDHVAMPLVSTEYQVLLRMPLDGSSVISSTVLAPGSQSRVAAGAGGAAWVSGWLSGPLLPLTALSSIGNSFGVRVTSLGTVDQSVRFGGLASTHPSYAAALATLTSLAVDASGQPNFAGGVGTTLSPSFTTTQAFDLPLLNPPTAVLPSTLRDAVVTSCAGSVCSGSAAMLARVDPSTATPSLALSTDALPILTLRNLGSAQANLLQIVATGFSEIDTCGGALAAGGECSIALTGAGPGTIRVQAGNAAAQIANLPVSPLTLNPGLLVFSPKELDFGIETGGSPAVTRDITVSNLGTLSQTFISALSGSARIGRFVESGSDCTVAGSATTKLLAPGGSCHITIAFTASSAAGSDGFANSIWTVGDGGVVLSGYSQAAALSVSATEIDFGTQFVGGLRSSRQLYLSNSSANAITHLRLTVAQGSPFAVIDRCPTTLEPRTVCQIQIDYRNSSAPANDSTMLALDQGIAVLVTGETLLQRGVNGSSVNPNLSVVPAAMNFANPVVVTGVSSGSQTATIRNSGSSAFALSLSVSGDFIDSTNCGASLAGGASCDVVLSLAPSLPGTRDGLLAVSTGSGTSPWYVALTGTGLPMLAANNGTLDFGGVYVSQPSVRWYKITQRFSQLTAVSSNADFRVILAEDIGYGHGDPASATFRSSAVGSCVNCYLGIVFRPAAAGARAGTLTLSSGGLGNAYVLSLSGSGLPLTGLILSPLTQDFGPVAVSSSSAPVLFTLTNLLPGDAAVSVSAPVASGDFGISGSPTGGAPCNGMLQPAASCFVAVAFAPTAAGQSAGTLTIPTGSGSITAGLIGFGSADAGLSLSPTSLTFANLPGRTATQQSITLRNTSQAALQVGAMVTSTASFQVTSTCGLLAPASTCSISVIFVPSLANAADTLQIPVTFLPGGLPTNAVYTVALRGAYTTEDSGLQILPGEANFGPNPVDSIGGMRQFTINNLTAKALSISIAIPRQFVLASAPCAGLAPNASCSFLIRFLPLTNGNITGTLFAQGVPADGSATLNGLGYLEGYGDGTNALRISADGVPGSPLSFGLVGSGQTASRVVTLTNSGGLGSAGAITIRRVMSEWPFLSTTTCGATLATGQTCTVTITYTPLNQIAVAGGSPPFNQDAGTLMIESDAVSSPDIVDLAGSSTPVVLASPSNSPPLVTYAASQSSLTFAATSVGSPSAPQTVTLANTGTTTIHITGVMSSADFTASSSCGALIPSASCALTVTFTPTGLGTRMSALEIVSDAGSSLEFISLIGVATPSSLQLLPAALDFGSLKVGLSATLPVQVGNTGGTAATFNGVSSVGDFTAGGTCPSAGNILAAGATCILQVTFTPTIAGVRTGLLSVASSATTFPITAALTGSGTQSHLLISPASLSFGNVALRGSESLSLTIANLGGSDITGVALAVTGDYAVAAPCSVTTLRAGSSCSVTIVFSPTLMGVRNGTLTVTSSDSGSPAALALTGGGFQGGSFLLTVNGASSSGVAVKSGAPASYALQVTPQNGFTGAVVLNCTPVNAAVYATCSLLPSALTLNSSMLGASATINTVATVAGLHLAPSLDRRLRGVFLCLLAPTLFLSWKARTSREYVWRRLLPLAWVVIGSAIAFSAVGCGSGGNASIRFTPAGTYQYQVTASSTTGVPVTQTVTLNLTVQ